MVDAMTGFNSKRDAAADKDALFEKFEVAQPAQEPLHIVQSNGKHSPLLTHMMSKRTTPPAAPVQEPTGMLHIDRLGQWLDASLKERKRPWVGLTDDELADIWYKESLDWMEFARAHEAALKKKNT